ncbi:hypothetical protein [Epilithonimonas sp.]|uniref:hypothetical protein n=1 Tax=Epilithonimonas sp. TaxID=2894511 RepID=UPI0028B0640B|nr:hypothetical protein [Epilithonimonas sp.]
MEKFFLKAKHWQLFLIFFCLMFVFQVSFFIQIAVNKSIDFFGLQTTVFLISFLSWFYFLTLGLNKKIENENLKTNSKYLLLYILFPVLYILIVFTIFPNGFNISTQGETDANPLWLLIIFPIHLFSMFCIFYLMYKTAKTIKIAEIQKPVKFVDFAGEFFLLWFFPIGIWFLQPKINKLAE